MAHDVFVSHSHKDKVIADAICTNLETAGVRCWIAPRDIGPGEQWPEAIGREIPQSRVMVMIFSSDSNNSDQVYRELFIAANNKVVIIPFKIEDVEPNPRIGYLLAGTHWLDAISPPMKEQINILVMRVKLILSGPYPPPPLPIPEPARRIPTWAWLMFTLVLVLVAGAASVYLLGQTPKTIPSPSPVLSQTNTQVISGLPALSPLLVPSLTNTPEEISSMPASGSQAEQTRTFAEPILTAIAQRKPDFEDDFNTVNPDWFFNDMQGTSVIEDGVARIHSTGDVFMSNDKALTGKDFVLQFDARLVSGDTTSQINIGLHGVSDKNKFFLFIHPAVNAWEVGGVWGSNFTPSLASGTYDMSDPIGKTLQIAIITRGSQFALYLNKTPMGFFDNSNFDNAGKTGIDCSSFTPAVCEFDNVKFWNLANIPGLP